MDASIVIPVYNAGDIVKDSVERITRVLDLSGLNYEIFLRDDGSTDGSREALRKAASQYPRVKSFYNASNEGLGATLRKLFNDARNKNIVYCDCDLPYGAEIIPVLLNKLERYDIVVASRYRGAPNKVWFLRKAFSRIYHLFCKLLFNVPVADIGSGSVAMRRQVLDAVDLEARGFDIHAEFYVKAAKLGFSIEEIPVEADRDARQGSFNIRKHAFPVFIETIRLRFKLFSSASYRVIAKE